MQIVYLILHYKNIQDTIKCVTSISNKESGNIKIVVIDNGSQDGSFEQLKNLYKEEGYIDILSTDANLGFSEGNNFGYSYIKRNYNPDYIVISNNDIIFTQKDFNKKIVNIFEKERFHLLGPDIYVQITGEHQSPIRLDKITSDEVKKELNFYNKYTYKPRKYVYYRKIQILKNKLYFKSVIFRTVYDKLKHKKNINRDKIYYGCCLQGACIIVSKLFIDIEEKIFTPSTFLYREEQFLHLRCMRNDYKIVYNPDLMVWHEDSSSIKNITNNAYEKAIFTLKHHVLSCETLLDYLLEYEENLDDKI